MQPQIGATKDYTVTKELDYLSFTSKVADKPFSTKLYQLQKSVNPNYDMCEQHISGMLHMWSSTNKKVGHHWLLTGSTIAWLRANTMHERELVAKALAHGNISRIDIAITSEPVDKTVHEFKPQEVAIACLTGMLKSRLKPDKDVANNMVTETKYIGNRKTRRRLFRAYDKGIDLGLQPNIQIRYELETRKNANVIARQITQGKDYGAIMRAYVDFPQVEAFQKIIDAEPAIITRQEEIPMSAEERDKAERMRKWLWLQDSIAPMIAKLLVRDAQADGTEMLQNEQLHEFMQIINRKVYENSQ